MWGKVSGTSSPFPSIPEPHPPMHAKVHKKDPGKSGKDGRKCI